MRLNGTTIGLALGMLLSGAAMAQNDAATTKAVEPDNSATNRAVVGNQPTADNQSNDKADVTLVASVRRAIVNDKTLSTYAHNVKIVAKNGLVTMTGPVQNATERQTVTKIASDIVGPQNVNADGIVAKK